MSRRGCEAWGKRVVASRPPPASCHCERSEESMQCGELQKSHSRETYCAIIDCNAIIDCMASITIRNLEESTKRKLKIQAAQNGRSMEQEAREILKSALHQKQLETPKTGADLVRAIRARFEPLGGVELELPPREPIREPDWLKDWK